MSNQKRVWIGKVKAARLFVFYGGRFRHSQRLLLGGSRCLHHIGRMLSCSRQGLFLTAGGESFLASNRTNTVQKGRQPMAINHSPRPLLEGTFKRHAPTGGQSCWFHFIAAVKSDLERLLSSLSIHPLAEKRLIDGTGIPTVDEYEGYIFLSLFIIDPSGRMANVRLLAAERHIIATWMSLTRSSAL